MRIGLQGPRKGSQIGGGATFEQAMFEGLVDGLREHPHILVVFSQQPCPSNFAKNNQIEWIRVKWIAWRNLTANIRRLVNWALNHLLRFPSLFRSEHWIDAYLRRHRVEFFLNLVPETIPTDVPYMVFIWDLMHRVLPFFPECSQRGAWVRRELMFSTMIRRAAILGVGTEVGKSEVINFYHVPNDRVHVLPFPTPQFALEAALSPVLGTASKVSDLGGDYVFYPASFHAHKNHVTLLHAVALLRDRHGLILQIALSGGDWGNLAHIKEVVARLGLEQQVHFLGFVARSELIRLYREARVLVFASLAGPDNIPPLEAFALGCPAIVADIPGAAEQLQGAACLFPPTDEQALADAILRVHQDNEYRESLIAKGRLRAQSFTSRDMGRAALKIIGEFEVVRRCWASGTRYPSRYNWARLFGL